LRYLFVAISSVILFFPVYWLFHAVVGQDWGAGIAAFFMYIWYPVMALKFLSRNDRFEPSEMSEALAEGNLDVSCFTVYRCIDIEETEDEGPICLLDIGEGRTLGLSGQYLYDAIATNTFPSREIKVFWNRRTGETYGVEGIGTRIDESQTLPSLTEHQWNACLVPKDRQIVNQSLDQIVEALTNIRK